MTLATEHPSTTPPDRKPTWVKAILDPAIVVVTASLCSAAVAFAVAWTGAPAVAAGAAVNAGTPDASAGLEARLGELERQIAAMPPAARRRSAARLQAPVLPPEPSEERVDAVTQRALAESNLREAAQHFETEPVARHWAAGAETRLRDAFSSDEAVAMDVKPPLASKVECRSSTCRITARYEDEGVAGNAAGMLLMDIAELLPRARVNTVTQPDGTSELVIYAYADPRAP